ncbi:RNA polymerase sigma-70 factor [Parabacteroides johnsonii DSM 18315]|jgi:RNA polymerase sigma-70 factor (family 1)|uniref:RNA polymerase subunit sigma-70 n=2 Tax=Parabacteroides johnsonii TaxID=387661 RepID=A0A9Q5SR71_9BACT|nr:RNA polymerase sigma-70 factor [Parabacteroides johnsonii]EEC97410.1 RNA polymerase sigma-70 factor [Parabacteroides johnsonii DSM 18315]MCS3050052.1 RNA polymerase sigma-70 factor [Parabacteroides johnsonii]OUO04686.1 RNA polymerase subunit sigma-70 [Parabacteroides johnsonii]UEA91577.1 RNA polymerase sigma-70 factor [Parabacteroides johnsonii]UWP43730.1 RNA polymerase sigma-70 factor [Parabacteroides johnsonii DSM 18315]
MGGSGSCDCFSDEYLLALLGKGDEQAFTIIYQRYHKLLYVVAYKYLKNDCSAKDSVQQIFYRLWESRSVLIINMNLRNYLYTMLKNHLLNEIRNNYMAMEKNYELAQEKVEYEDDLLDNIEKKEIEEQLYRAINGLPEQKKQVCLYKLRGNLSNLEIANKMGISVPTVKTHYAQAVKMLREHFNKLLFMIYSFWLS